LEESNQPLSSMAKQERLCQAKGKEVRQPQYENHGRNKRDAGRTSTVKLQTIQGHQRLQVTLGRRTGAPSAAS
jgi:hypothetical protein